MPRVIAVRVGRLPAPVRFQADGMGVGDVAGFAIDSSRTATETVGLTDSATPQLSGGGAGFGANFGATFGG